MYCPTSEEIRASVKLLAAIVLLSAPLSGLGDEEQSYPVAGINPDQRPVNAPVLQPIQKDEAWYQKGLHGVEPPYPPSLTFLEDQGRWYTPFTRRGMTGPYDIRGWHTR